MNVGFDRIDPNDAALCLELGRRAAKIVRDIKQRTKNDAMLDPDALLIAMDFACAHLRRDLKLMQLLYTSDLEFTAEFVAITKACRNRVDDQFPNGVHLTYASKSD